MGGEETDGERQKTWGDTAERQRRAREQRGTDPEDMGGVVLEDRDTDRD